MTQCVNQAQDFRPRLLKHSSAGISKNRAFQDPYFLPNPRQRPEAALPERVPLPGHSAARSSRLVAGEPSAGCP